MTLLSRTACYRTAGVLATCNLIVVMFNVYTYKPCKSPLPQPAVDGIVPARLRQHPRLSSNGTYMLVEDWVMPDVESPTGNQSITLTTQGTAEFLYHVVTLCQKWQGPLSVAAYGPGSDFLEVEKEVHRLRNESACVRDNVTWHLVYDRDHPPPCPNCTAVVAANVTYKDAHKLIYPINVLRNFARTKARTYYVLASDIELYPSEDLIPLFLKMISQKSSFTPRDLFVLPIFEVRQKLPVPRNKSELLQRLAKKEAVFFHKFVCEACQRFPRRDQWPAAKPLTDTLSVFVSSRRNASLHSWEPIYIGTNYDPLYEERLSWEGKRDKMSQMFELCILNSTMHVLDAAFLTHAPGIKHIEAAVERRRAPFVLANNRVYARVIADLVAKYGGRRDC